MKVSLIVCTRNRAEQLERCLDAIALIPAGDWELVLVDNGSTRRFPQSRRAVFRRFRGELIGEVLYEHSLRRTCHDFWDAFEWWRLARHDSM